MKRSSSLFLISTILVLFLLWGCIPTESTTQTSTPKAAPTKAGTAPSTVAWQERWDQMVTEAQKEGKVMLYGEVYPELRTLLIQALKDKFGIELDVVSGKAPEVAQKFLSESQVNVHLADVLMTGQTTTVVVIKPRGVIVPIPPMLVLPEVTDPKAWREGKVPYLDKDAMAVPLVASYRSFLVLNNEMVAEREIQSYQDLLSPQWKGKVIFFDPTITGSGGTWVAFMLTKVMGMEEGTKFLRQFAQQEPVLTRDARFQVESVAKKKYPLGLGASSQVVSDFLRVQAPVEWAKVKEGGIVIPGGAVIAMPQKPPHPNAAAVLFNWLLTKEGQTVFSKGFGHPASRLDVSTEGIDPSVIPREGVKLYWLDEEFIFQESKLIALSREIFGPLMK